MKRWLFLSSFALVVFAAGLSQAAGLIVVPDSVVTPGPGPGYSGRLLPTPSPVPPPSVGTFRPHRFAPLEVTYHRVQTRIRDQIATTSIDQEFYNPSPQTTEGTFLFPIPRGAHLDRFTMEIGGRPVEAELLSADKARRIYEDIVRSMKDPALLEYVGRDLYRARIFPIEGHGRKRVTLSYSQVLKSDSGLVTYLYPLNLGQFSARPIPNLSVKIELESSSLLKTVFSPTHTVEVRRPSDRQAVIQYEASNQTPNADFQLFFSREKEDVGMSLLSFRRGSEPGYFLLLASPGIESKPKQLVQKDVAFVLDTSGSMAGAKIEQAKKALRFCVENLNAGDRFEVLRFSSETEPLFQRLVEVTRENKTRATEFIADLRAIGGTAIDDALRHALALRPENSERPYMVIFLTDGRPTVGATGEDQIVAGVKQRSGGNTRVFSFGIGTDVNTHLLDRITEETRAFSQYVLPEEDIEVKVSNFFSKFNEPVLSHLKLNFGEGIRVTQMYPSPLPDLFKGEQLILLGRYTGAGRAGLDLEGRVNSDRKRFAYDAEFPERAVEHDFIPRLWATRRVGYLLDEIRLRGESQELRDEVTELARQYGIVTPYTAYLITEDEARRRVPVSAQTLPRLQEDSEARRLSRRFYDAFNGDLTGDAAVAGSRYGLALKQANNASDALASGQADVQRGFAFGGASVSSSPAPTALPGAPPVLATKPSPNTRLAAIPGTTAAFRRTTSDEAAQRINQYAQQTRFVNGRSFYQNGTQWVDATSQKLSQTQRQRIQFNSTEYFDLLIKNPDVAPWLALGQNIVFAHQDKVYEIYE